MTTIDYIEKSLPSPPQFRQITKKNQHIQSYEKSQDNFFWNILQLLASFGSYDL